MAKAETHSHLTRRWNVWFACLTVPVDVCPVIGRNIFIISTHARTRATERSHVVSSVPE